MKKEYETPTLERIIFALNDVVLASTEGGGGGVDWGDDEDEGFDFP